MKEQELKGYIIQRIENMPRDTYNNSLEVLRTYGIQSHDYKGRFILIESMASNFNKIYKLLEENDVPDELGIQKQLITFLATIQTIVGIRKFNEFISICEPVSS